MTFHGRVSPRLTENHIEKKRDDIFEIKCNDTTAVVSKTAVVGTQILKKIVAGRYHCGCFQNRSGRHKNNLSI